MAPTSPNFTPSTRRRPWPRRSGAPFSTTVSGTVFGFSIDPASDIGRVTSNANENFTVNLNNLTLIAQNTILTPTTSDVVGIAYADNMPGASTTTLYGYDVSDDNLVIIGTAGSSSSANAGVVTPVGSSGVTTGTATANETGFAIDANGAAYVNLEVGGTSGLYMINLCTGAVAANVRLWRCFNADVAVAPATGFVFSNLAAPRIATATSPTTVTAVDPYGDKVVGYQGTVKFTSSDPSANLPGNTSLVGGSNSVNVTFNTVCAQSSLPPTLPAKTSPARSVISRSSLPWVSWPWQAAISPSISVVLPPVRLSASVPSAAWLVGKRWSPSPSGRPTINCMAWRSAVTSGNFIPSTRRQESPPRWPRRSHRPANDTTFGFGFSPVADTARVITNNNENLSINPSTGALISSDGTLSPSITSMPGSPTATISVCSHQHDAL